MKYINFVETLNWDSYNEFLEQLNELETNDDICISISSCGGSTVVSRLMASIFNNDSRIKKVIFSWENVSAALDLILLTHYSKRIVSPDAYTMIHLATRNVDFRNLINENASQQKFLIEDLKSVNQKMIQMFKKIGVPDSDIELIEMGKEVFYNNEKLLSIISNYDEEVGIYA